MYFHKSNKVIFKILIFGQKTAKIGCHTDKNPIWPPKFENRSVRFLEIHLRKIHTKSQVPSMFSVQLGSIARMVPKPPSSCWYKSRPLPQIHISESCFQDWKAWTLPPPPLSYYKIIILCTLYYKWMFHALFAPMNMKRSWQIICRDSNLLPLTLLYKISSFK